MNDAKIILNCCKQEISFNKFWAGKNKSGFTCSNCKIITKIVNNTKYGIQREVLKVMREIDQILDNKLKCPICNRQQKDKNHILLEHYKEGRHYDIVDGKFVKNFRVFT